MKMAIRLDMFELGLDQEITILDLRPRMTAEAFEHAALQPQNESLCEYVLDEIDARRPALEAIGEPSPLPACGRRAGSPDRPLVSSRSSCRTMLA